MDYKFKTEPYEHQLTALGASHKKENFALFMEMGTGKSKVLIDNIAMLYDRGKINAALIIAPKGVYHNWERQELPIHMPEHVLYQTITWSPVETKKQQGVIMAKKEKKEQPVLSLDGKEYVIEDMTDEEKQMINHINDMQNKINTNLFIREQLEVGKEAFIGMIRTSLSEEKVEEVVDAEVEEAEA